MTCISYLKKQFLLYFPKKMATFLSFLSILFLISSCFFFFTASRLSFLLFLACSILCGLIAFQNRYNVKSYLEDSLTEWKFSEDNLMICYRFRCSCVQDFEQLTMRSICRTSSQEYSFNLSCINSIYWCEDISAFIILYDILSDVRVDKQFKISNRLSNVPYTIFCPASDWHVLSKQFMLHNLFVRQSTSDSVADYLFTF